MRKVKSGELEWIEEENGKIAYAKIIEKNPFTGLFELSHKNGVKRRVKSYKNESYTVNGLSGVRMEL